MPKLLGVGVQGVFGTAVLRAGLGKEHLARGIVAGQRSGVLVSFGLTDQPNAGTRLAQAGIVDLAGGLQAGEQRPLLGRAHPQRHLADERGGALGRVVGRVGLPGHACLLGKDDEHMFYHQYATGAVFLQRSLGGKSFSSRVSTGG